MPIRFQHLDTTQKEIEKMTIETGHEYLVACYLFFYTCQQTMATIFLTPSPVTSQSVLTQKSLRLCSVIKCCEKSEETINISYNGKAGFHEKSTEVRQRNNNIIPPRPRRIILVRHGESEGNLDESAYTRIPDPKIALTEKGKVQSEESGRRIREMIAKDCDDWKVYFYVSPYRRTVETLQYLGRAFERERIAGIIKEPRLREQDFGTENLNRVSIAEN